MANRHIRGSEQGVHMHINTFEDACVDAYFRSFGPTAPCPSSDVDRIMIAGMDLAVLTNCNGVLAVYRGIDRGKFWTGEVELVDDECLIAEVSAELTSEAGGVRRGDLALRLCLLDSRAVPGMYCRQAEPLQCLRRLPRRSWPVTKRSEDGRGSAERSTARLARLRAEVDLIDRRAEFREATEWMKSLLPAPREMSGWLAVSGGNLRLSCPAALPKKPQRRPTAMPSPYGYLRRSGSAPVLTGPGGGAA